MCFRDVYILHIEVFEVFDYDVQRERERERERDAKIPSEGHSQKR